ncbi:MAG: thioredoxin-dependent thiol peroxidase [Maricaulaceae bacterium]|jgi:peroxiredoxin Q/BCP
MSSPQVGDPAPRFALPADGGREVKLSELKGKKVVLYFYPKDDTSGCTKEAADFTSKLAAFKRAGATIVGVSKDSVDKHDKFKAKHDLKVTLASDEDGATLEDYGVWVEKSMYGRSFMGIERATFLIDAKGKIAQVWRRVRVPGHVDAVLEAVKAL